MLKVTRITKTLDVSEAGEGAEGTVQVWVNVSRVHWQAYTDLVRAGVEINERIRDGKLSDGAAERRQQEWVDTALDWWTETWGVSRQELEQFHNDAPAALWVWMTQRSLEMIQAYREGIAGKKAGNGSSPGSMERESSSRESSVE